MGFEGDDLVSDLLVVDDVPLSALTGDEDVAAASRDDTAVPVAEFQSSV
jgi:hypothetical protein